MLKKTILLLFAIIIFAAAKSQTKQTTLDSLPDYEALFGELENFLDSITAPRSFSTVNVGISNGWFQYQTANGATMQERRKLFFTPTAGYYNKNGLGIIAVASVISDAKLLLYQTAVTASYDYLKKRKLLTGLSVTHFFTKKDLPFYTSPLNNEINAYVTYRGWWLKPALAAGYGRGTLTSVEERKEKIKLLKGKPLNSTTTIETTETISDFSLTASVKHDFYLLNLLSKRDYFRITPQLVFTSGTQKYGLAQTNNSYVSEKHSSASILYNSEKSVLTAHSQFQALSLSGRLRTEFSKGIFFVQPQFLFDHYFSDAPKTISIGFVVNAGILF